MAHSREDRPDRVDESNSLDNLVRQVNEELLKPSADQEAMVRLFSGLEKETQQQLLNRMIEEFVNEFDSLSSSGMSIDIKRFFFSAVKAQAPFIPTDDFPLFMECVVRGAQYALDISRGGNRSNSASNYNSLMRALDKAEPWGGKFGGALMMLIGAAMIATSIFAIVATLGAASPLVVIVAGAVVGGLVGSALAAKGAAITFRPQPIARASRLVSTFISKPGSVSAPAAGEGSRQEVFDGDSLSGGMTSPRVTSSPASLNGG